MNQINVTKIQKELPIFTMFLVLSLFQKNILQRNLSSEFIICGECYMMKMIIL